MKRGLVSYRRDEDEEDSPAVHSHLAPISPASSKGNSSGAPQNEPSASQRGDIEEETSNKSADAQNKLLLASTHADSPNAPLMASKTRYSTPKVAYSTWTSEPRPVSASTPEVERFIAWAQSGKSINSNLRSTREFQNPSMLVGLVTMCGIREGGTNIPTKQKGLSFLRSDFYEALLDAQEAHLAARVAYQQPGKRSHIEFVKRPSGDAHQSAPPPKRFKR